MTIERNGRTVVGFGDEAVSLPIKAPPSTWTVALATSVVGAATGWVIEEIASNIRGRKKRQ